MIETEYFCRTLPISNDPVNFKKFDKKIVQKPREWSLTKHLNFDRGKFLIQDVVKTIYGGYNENHLCPAKFK